MKKIVAVVNPAVPAPILLNAVGHAALGLGAMADPEGLALRSFEDRAARDLGMMTDHPLIILKAKKTVHLLRCVDDALQAGLVVNVFLQAHRFGEPAEQARTIRSDELAGDEIVAILIAGDADQLREVTRRCSLFDERSAAAALSPG
nr:DUF2000 family protein [uncultured Hyphomonas sp.]